VDASRVCIHGPGQSSQAGIALDGDLEAQSLQCALKQRHVIVRIGELTAISVL
jgi:hypothetical protein